jgi:hypothetical protein
MQHRCQRERQQTYHVSVQPGASDADDPSLFRAQEVEGWWQGRDMVVSPMSENAPHRIVHPPNKVQEHRIKQRLRTRVHLVRCPGRKLPYVSCWQEVV